MGAELITILRPTHYERCRTCPLMDKVVEKAIEEVEKVIEKDSNTIGAKVTITCLDSNYAQAKVSPNVKINFNLIKGFHDRFSSGSVIICPEIIASRKERSKTS